MDKRVNANYEIIVSVPTGRLNEIVIGHNPDAAAPYVCWYCHNGNNYNTGIYCQYYRDALDALAERIKTNYDYLPRYF